MMWVMAPAIAVAGLYLFLKEAAPAVAALRSGRIRTKAHASTVVERSSEPHRFRKLVNQRLLLAGAGLFSVIGSGGS